MGDLLVSAAVLGAVVLLSEATRRAAARLLPAGLRLSALEAASTFQLCSCTHELKLLADSSRLDAPLGLSLCFLMTVVHILSFREATCNPCAALERLVRGRSSLLAALVLVGLQFGAAVAAQSFASCVWSLGLSAVHAQHRRFGFRCFDPLGGSLLEAAAAELGCAFCVHAAAMHAHKLDEKLRVPFMAAVITALVYTAGGVSGAVFNPVLAFSTHFPCSGHTYLEYCFVYWLGPVLGMSSCILLFEKIIPFLSGKTTIRPDVPAAHKQKTQ